MIAPCPPVYTTERTPSVKAVYSDNSDGEVAISTPQLTMRTRDLQYRAAVVCIRERRGINRARQGYTHECHLKEVRGSSPRKLRHVLGFPNLKK
jgi:hypothetical protein